MKHKLIHLAINENSMVEIQDHTIAEFTFLSQGSSGGC